MTNKVDYDAVVVGAGFAGLPLIHHLKKTGISVKVLDKASEIGGTWTWNRYPGAATDSEGYYYCLTFSKEILQEWTWSERYPGWEETNRYLNFVADKCDMWPHIQLNTEVKSAEFIKDDGLWCVKTGTGEETICKYFISAMGMISQPVIPKYNGMSNYKGPCFHSSRWPQEGLEYEGKKVGIVGCGASTVQMLPIMAQTAESVTVFQRTPNFVLPAMQKPMTPEWEKDIKDNYEEIINKVCELINDISDNFDDFSVGIGMPGSLHPETGLVQVSNTKALEGQNVKNDLEKKLGYEVKIANDADCLAVSESIDGSGMNYDSVFAVIMGTGVGAGYTFRNQLVVGPNKLTGEWGQNPIPGPMDDYEKSVKRHCGRVGAIEVFLSGPGLENFYSFITNESKTSKEIVELFRNGDKVSKQIMDKYFERTARSFSSIVNILDPDVIVCGGGMSEIEELYEEVPKRIIPYIASNFFNTPIVKSKHGSSSGVRGAALLWD